MTNRSSGELDAEADDRINLIPPKSYLKMIITTDMNEKPYKYATHCLKVDEYNSILICKDGKQFVYLNSTWQPANVYPGILKEIEIEYHPNIDKECNLISRKDIKRYQEILDTEGLKQLQKIHTDLCNSNSMGAVPNIVAIEVVLFNNDLINH